MSGKVGNVDAEIKIINELYYMNVWL